VITAVTPKATWLRLDSLGVEGRLVRGLRGMGVGDRIPVVLLSTDAERGYIDFARDTAALGFGLSGLGPAP
jgi:exoribonuclease-2